jgi:RimJ/RimL family protein N-acetyltransferase
VDLGAGVALAAPPRQVNPLHELRTPRLLLERTRASDLADLLRMHADPVVMATLGGVRSEAVTRAQLDDFIQHWERHGFGPWMLRAPEDRRFLGRGGLRHVVVGGRPEVELLYALMPDAWGRGLASELAGESLRVAFAELSLPDVVAFTQPHNTRSRAVMERAGFQYERDVVHAGLPHVLYRLRAAPL